jgi:threonine synthase
MDVGDPSNFTRILEIFHQEFPALKQKLSSFSIDDEETMQTIERFYYKYNYVTDPHGAVGFAALSHFQENSGDRGIFLETAHPVKFPAAVEKATGNRIDLPGVLEKLMQQEKKSITMSATFQEFKSYLLS